MKWLYRMWAVFQKDVQLEIRTRFTLNTLFMFVAALLLLVLFAVGQQPLSPRVQSALLWIIIIFSGSVGLGRTFVSEEERGTVLFLRLNTTPSTVYAGKLLFNTVLTLMVNLLAVAGFWFFIDLQVNNASLFAATIVLGAIGLAGATTLLAAIIARTANRGPLFAVLSFPILVPLLLTVVQLTQRALQGHVWSVALNEILSLVGYAGVVITASILLFDYVWHD